MKPSDSPITEEDFRSIVHILAEVASMNGTLDGKRSYLMSDVGRLVGSDIWLWGVAQHLDQGKRPSFLVRNYSGIDYNRMALILKAIEHPESGSMTYRLASEMMTAGRQITRLRQEVIDDAWFLNSTFRPLWKQADIGPVLFSVKPIPGMGTSFVFFCRSAEAPPFTARESSIAHILLSEVAWLHEAAMPHAAANDIPKLPPRCRTVLNDLVRGRARKEIAADLGLSVHTVNDYMKQIFLHYGVHSQMDLVARFRCEDGHDKP